MIYRETGGGRRPTEECIGVSRVNRRNEDGGHLYFGMLSTICESSETCTVAVGASYVEA